MLWPFFWLLWQTHPYVCLCVCVCQGPPKTAEKNEVAHGLRIGLRTMGEASALIDMGVGHMDMIKYDGWLIDKELNWQP